MKTPLKSTKDLKGLDFFAVFLASGFFLSYLPAKFVMHLQADPEEKLPVMPSWTGAGIVGSFLGAITYLLLPPSLAMSPLTILGGVIFAVIISHRAEKAMQSHDDPRIVIDEWIGVWIAMWGLAPIINAHSVVAFVLFRFFDVFKGPWGNRLQKLPGGWGVTMDDVAAGVIANVLTRVVIFFF